MLQNCSLLIALGLVLVLASSRRASAADWPQWCGTQGKNMVSTETGLPETFTPGDKHDDGTIDVATAKNVKWGVKICNAIYSTPAVVGGKLFVGGMEPGNGIFACLDTATGKLLWKWKAPPRKYPKDIDGFHLGVYEIPPKMGVCSSAAVEDGRVYFVNNRFDLMCLDAAGEPSGEARVIWTLDMTEKLGVFPCDASNGSPLIDGDLLYVQTCNGIDRNSFQDPSREKKRKFPAPDAPNLIAVNKKTGQVVATDDLHIAPTILHGQWSSPSLGTINGRKLVFFGAGDARLYAFEALAAVPDQSAKLKVVWSCDLIPPEYKPAPDADWITLYSLGDKRVRGTLNKNDGSYVGLLEIIATPVVIGNRIYVGVGRDPDHGRGRGAMYCLDATRSGDTTQSAQIWKYQGQDRTLSTASVADGLVYICDMAGRLHCLDAQTGQPYWVHETRGETWGSSLVADGKVYMPTARGLWVLATGKELKVLSHINLGASILCSPVVANGTMYVGTTSGWLWAVK